MTLFDKSDQNKDASSLDYAYYLMEAGSEPDARQFLFKAMNLQDVAGAILIRVHKINYLDLPETQVIWDHDFSGELKNKTPHDVLSHIIEKTPKWLINWFAKRQRPFWFQRYKKFIPYSGRLLMILTGVGDSRPLSDLISVTANVDGDKYVLLIGFHDILEKDKAQEMFIVGLAYLKCIADSTHPMTQKVITNLSLSDIQLECLRWMAAGKSLKEIAIITEMSYANVRYHLEKAKNDNGYSSMQQLLVHAARIHNLSPLGPEKPFHTR